MKACSNRQQLVGAGLHAPVCDGTDEVAEGTTVLDLYDSPRGRTVGLGAGDPDSGDQAQAPGACLPDGEFAAGVPIAAQTTAPTLRRLWNYLKLRPAGYSGCIPCLLLRSRLQGRHLGRLPRCRTCHRNPSGHVLRGVYSSTGAASAPPVRPSLSRRRRPVAVPTISAPRILVPQNVPRSQQLTQAQLSALQQYISQLKARLDSVWNKPTNLGAARLSVTVIFDVSASGALSNVRFRASSGNGAFDQSVRDALSARAASGAESLRPQADRQHRL